MPFQKGDFVLIVYKDKKYLKKLEENLCLSIGKAKIKFEDIVGKKDGERVKDFFLFAPTLEDILLFGFKRKTQIIYPKDAFFVAFKLGIKKGDRVLEFGTGSGVFTSVVSLLAKEVYTFEICEDFFKLSLKNWQKFGLCKNVKAFNLDFAKARLKKEFFDACLVDVKEPWLYLEKIWRVLKKGKVCAFVLPTTNQVSRLLSEMEKYFAQIEVLEILHRYYKPNPERLRPQDRMVAHTTFLIFGRKKANKNHGVD